MLRSTSVVMTTTGASPLTDTSPVSRPTESAPYLRTRSAYFWLDRALIGVVEKDLLPWVIARCTANSPPAVLPEPVGAATRTPRPASRACAARAWNGSSSKSMPARDAASSDRDIAARSRAAANRSAGEGMVEGYVSAGSALLRQHVQRAGHDLA